MNYFLEFKSRVNESLGFTQIKSIGKALDCNECEYTLTMSSNKQIVFEPWYPYIFLNSEILLLMCVRILHFTSNPKIKYRTNKRTIMYSTPSIRG